MWKSYVRTPYFPSPVPCRSLARWTISSLQAISHGEMQEVRLTDNCWLKHAEHLYNLYSKFNFLLGDSVKLLVLVDQHAADERIRFERYLQGTY